MLAAWATAGLAAAGPAQAHAGLTSSDPADGARLGTAPAVVTLTFADRVGLMSGSLQVTDSTRGVVHSGEAFHPEGDRYRVAVILRPALPGASYLVRYSVVSADGHPVIGGCSFVVGDGPLASAGGALADARGTDPVVGGVFGVARWVSFCGLAVLGGLVFVVICWPSGRADRRARRVLRLGWLAAALGSAASLLLQGPYAAQRGLEALLSSELLTATMSLPVGKVLVLRLVALLALAAAATRLLCDVEHVPPAVRNRDEKIALVLGLVLLAGYAGAGHAESGILPTAVVISDMVHMAAMATWLDGLVLLTLVVLPRGRPHELDEVLPRFSRLAYGAICVLVVTGSYQAWRQIGSTALLGETAYGRLLTMKLIAVAGILLLGDLGRRAVQGGLVRQQSGTHPRSATDLAGGGEVEHSGPVPLSAEHVISASGNSQFGAVEAHDLRRLGATVACEVGLAALVLAVSAALVTTAPARSAQARPPERTVAEQVSASVTANQQG